MSKEPTDAERADFNMACLLCLVSIIESGNMQAAREYAAYVRELVKELVNTGQIPL
jgi:hypothetical protein